ncbi:MAG TPA: formate dehydrogenase accessory protein FdhE [Methylomirabilota bacterium]|nr:formate dehydrogenase accessory protein FdhE [Methylomirabilota bacterium]
MTTPSVGSPRAALAARQPECEAWLRLYDQAQAALGDSAWADAVPAPSDTTPFIDGAMITVDARAAPRLVQALLRRAGVRAPADDDAIALLEAAIAEDDAALSAVAVRAGIGHDIAAATGALATMPLLQACRQAWTSRLPDSWIDAACPVCGAWAAVTEERGLERRLRHRCGRCGADWSAQPVRCAFCGTVEHRHLTTLVSERTGERGRVEACGVCRGYVKTITTLTACAPTDVVLLDLETVHLDIAAIEHGFQRPPPTPRRVAVHAATRRRTGRLVALLGGRR